MQRSALQIRLVQCRVYQGTVQSIVLCSLSSGQGGVQLGDLAPPPLDGKPPCSNLHTTLCALCTAGCTVHVTLHTTHCKTHTQHTHFPDNLGSAGSLVYEWVLGTVDWHCLCCPLSTVNFPLSSVHFPLSRSHCQVSTVLCQVSTLHCVLIHSARLAC